MSNVQKFAEVVKAGEQKIPYTSFNFYPTSKSFIYVAPLLTILPKIYIMSSVLHLKVSVLVTRLDRLCLQRWHNKLLAVLVYVENYADHCASFCNLCSYFSTKNAETILLHFT